MTAEQTDSPAGAAQPAAGALNGWEVPDFLVRPIAEAALGGLAELERGQVPPRLAPLAGRTPRKLGKAEWQAALAALGRHRRFTEAALDRFLDLHAELVASYEGLPDEEVGGLAESRGDDPALAVSALVATDRLDAARELAARVGEPPPAPGPARHDVREARAEATRARHDLAAARRALRRTERDLARTEGEARASRARTAEAESRAAAAEARTAEALAGAEALRRRVAEVEGEIEAGRRERRDLLAELQDLEARTRRLRRELRETRAKLPPPGPAPVPPRAIPEAAPTLAELGRRYSAEGARGVLGSKRLLVIVDGWNVGLTHVPRDRLEDTRRILEQGLERYHGRTGNRVMVVYDGRKVDWFWVPRAGRPTIVRVFTPEGETADDYIVAELEAGVDGATPVVVTSDRELHHRCRALGAFVVTSEGLAEALGLKMGEGS